MRIVILLMIALLMTACKTKSTLKKTEVKKDFEKTEVKKDSIKNETKIRKKDAAKEILQSEQKKESQTTTEIKGKAEINKPVEMYNIENGDTLQAIKVTGNAEVYIRTNTSNSRELKKELSKESIAEKINNFSENIIRENNVKERVEEFKQKSKEAVTRTGSFWSFGLITIFGVVAIVIIGLIIYFKIK